MSKSFQPTIDVLQTKSGALSRVTGVASLNYRLSPYPSHPSAPSSPSDPARNIFHPDHVCDVLAALRYLQQAYGFGHQYLLVGHSCGATLALQCVMRSQEAPSATPFDATSNNAGPNAPEPFLNPVGILGVEGVYDLVGLRDRHFESSIYQDIVTNAFGLDEREWRKASPTTWLLEKASLAESWPEGRVLVIAQSHEDGLVEDDQATELLHAVGLDGNRSAGRKDELMWLRGLHDQIWEEGHELAAAILHSICLLAPPSSRLS